MLIAEIAEPRNSRTKILKIVEDLCSVNFLGIGIEEGQVVVGRVSMAKMMKAKQHFSAS